MDVNILKGQWKELKGEIKHRWGKLTDDDLLQIEGDQEKFLGALQKRYGYGRDEAEKEYKEFISRFKEPAHRV
jgi:uncharacterized protein YjbJ (UPF0337 family)